MNTFLVKRPGVKGKQVAQKGSGQLAAPFFVGLLHRRFHRPGGVAVPSPQKDLRFPISAVQVQKGDPQAPGGEVNGQAGPPQADDPRNLGLPAFGQEPNKGGLVGGTAGGDGVVGEGANRAVDSLHGDGLLGGGVGFQKGFCLAKQGFKVGQERSPPFADMGAITSPG